MAPLASGTAAGSLLGDGRLTRPVISLLDWSFIMPVNDRNPWEPLGKLQEGCVSLQEAHIPFDVVYVGDSELVKRPLSLKTLQRFAAVVLPTGHELEASDRATLDGFSSRRVEYRARISPIGATSVSVSGKWGHQL